MWRTGEATAALLSPFWRITKYNYIVLTVWILVVGNTTNAQNTKDITEYIFGAYTRACRLLIKTRSEVNQYKETEKVKVTILKENKTFPINEAIDQINQTGLLNSHNMTVITIHGFNDHAASDTTLGIANVYRRTGRHNVVLLDCSDLTSGNYIRAVIMSELIGRKLAYVLTKLAIDPNQIHIVGMSLGAQTAGWTGRYYKSMNGKKLFRITGLDPAGPCFTYGQKVERLSEEDADFVDVIHTNRGIQGIVEDVGHADFFVNGGGPNQPGCEGSACSHHRAVAFFLESFDKYSQPFLARNCSSWQKFNDNFCHNNEVVLMGYNTTTDARGSFFLRTSSSEPFSLGASGANPKYFQRTFVNMFYNNYFG